MQTTTINRPPDYDTREWRNISWSLLARTASAGRNLAVLVQRFEPGGAFAEHAHDLEQFFYVTRGEMEMTIGGQSAVYRAGDFVAVGRNELHAGRNLSEGIAELLVLDYWPPDSQNRIGLE
jgi:quercetin dioxygenase-like cupin family protein